MNRVQRMHVHVVNAKMTPVETVPGIRWGRMGRALEWVNSNMIYSIHFKNICKCCNVPLPRTTTKNEKGKYITHIHFLFFFI
jgi:hypothetical protein